MEEELTKNSFVPMSWEEFYQRVDKLCAKVQKYLKENNLKLSAIVPILREGGFVGLYFAFKFNTCKVIPIQFKYFLKKGIDPFEQEPIQLTSIPRIHYKLPNNPVFLLTDVLPGGGKTARAVGELLRQRFPGCKIIYTCLFKEVSFKKPDFFEVVIEEVLTDETGKLTEEERKRLGVEDTLYLLPWQNVEEELAPLTEKEYKYDF